MRISYGEKTDFILCCAWVYVGSWLLFFEPLFSLISCYEAGRLSIKTVLFAALKIIVSLTCWREIEKDIKLQENGIKKIDGD